MLLEYHVTYSLIIFDCDGTLVDSEYLNTVAIVDILHEFGLTHYSVEQALEDFVGLRFSTILQNITEDTGHVFPDNSAKLYLERVRELAPTHMKHIEGARDLILTAQKSAKTCVVSNGERNNVLSALEFSNLKELFDEEDIITGLMAPNPKPAPDLFLLAAKNANIPLSKTLVIEDSVTGVEAAKAADMDVWGFCGTHHEPKVQAKTLLNIGAHNVYFTMNDIINDLEKIQRAKMIIE